jgi:glycosyltransferase involved in cell wall biosynthesis
MNLDIILPCYNPIPGWAENIVTCHKKLCELAPGCVFRLIIVNDGSFRNVEEQDVAHLRASIPHFEWVSYAENRGKGFAIRQGAALAHSAYVIFTDIDFPYLEEDLLLMFEELKSKQSDLVLGIRLGNYYEKAPLYRVFISKVLKVLIRFLLQTKVNDSQGGLKGFSRKGMAILQATTIDRYLFDLELLKKASHESGLKISSVPVTLKPHVVFAPIGLNILRREFVNFLKILWM